MNDPDGKLKMFYKGFDTHITLKYGVIIEGWPLPRSAGDLIAPSQVGSRPELTVLINAWKNDIAHFRKLTQSE